MSKRVRILHFVEQVNQYDFVDTLIRHMQSASLEAMLCVLHEHPNFITTDYRNIGIKFFNLDLYGRKSYLKVIARILTIIKEENIEILHCHLYDMAFLGAAIKWLNPSIKLVTSRHYSDDLYLTSKGWKLKRALWIEKFSNNKADAIISPSQVITDLLIRQGVKPCKINRIDYCFDFSADKYIPSVDNDEYLSIRKRLLRQPNDCFLIGNFARHYFLKNQVALIEAVALLLNSGYNIHLLLCGNGQMQPFYKQKVKELNIAHAVTFTDWVKAPKHYIMACDLIVHPTQGEAFPQIMVECMALEKVIAITRVSGATEHIVHMETGLILASKEVESITETIVHAFKTQEQLQEIGKRARKYVLEKLNLYKIIPKYEYLYKHLLK